MGNSVYVKYIAVTPYTQFITCRDMLTTYGLLVDNVKHFNMVSDNGKIVFWFIIGYTSSDVFVVHPNAKSIQITRITNDELWKDKLAIHKCIEDLLHNHGLVLIERLV